MGRYGATCESGLGCFPFDQVCLEQETAIKFRLLIVFGIVLLYLGGGALAPSAKAQNVTRMLFTPPVVPETQTDPVRFEATVTGNPSSVLFNYNNVDRPMFDDGTHGDLVAGDAVWTILFTPAEILSKNTAARVFRPFIGFCKPAGGSVFNVVAEVWTSAIGLRDVRSIDAGGQETDYIANYVATSSQLQNFDQRVWAQRFYATHGDKYDFLNFVLVEGPRSNRFHFATRNSVQGIGLGIFNNTSQYGSAGKLQGINTFPISSFFDGGDQGFEHETGHQWINFLAGTPFASGTPHWARGNVAINVMGFSIPGSGGVGGNYSFTFSPNGSGGYLVGNLNAINQTTFNSMELYLMGLIPPSEVDSFFVLNNQNQDVTVGQTLQPSEITPVTVNDVIAARGARVPDSSQSQKNFRVATIVVSEQLLDAYAMAHYDYFARRAEERQQLTFASGLATGTCNPWYLATGARSVMVSQIADPPATPLQLLLETSGPTFDQVAALDSVLFLRDPFPSVNEANLLNQGSDRNTRVTVFVKNLQLGPGEPSSAVVVTLVDSNIQIHVFPAEDVRPVPNFDFTQVIFRLPNNLPAGTCTIKINAQGQTSNSGTIRIRI
jgi:hypothetical protein